MRIGTKLNFNWRGETLQGKLYNEDGNRITIAVKNKYTNKNTLYGVTKDDLI